MIATLLPIAGVAWAWQMGAVNVPKWDDHVFKGFLLALEKETSLGGVLKQFLKQHNEHRIAYDRLFVWLDYNLFGKFSYKRLMAYGDLSLLALVALFGTYLARYARARWYIFLPPVALFIISLANWENLYWALSAMQNFGIVVWSLWAFYALSHRQSPWLAIGLAAVATLVSGNGFLVWPIGAAMLLAQRRFRPLLPWLGAAVVLIALYFFDYKQPTVAPPARGTVVELVVGWFAFLGAAADALPASSTYLLSAALGTALISFWAYVFVRNVPSLRQQTGWAEREAFVFGVVAFIVATAAVVVWSRIGTGRETLLTSRYRIYSLTLLAITYCYWLTAVYKKYNWKAALGGLAASGLLWWSAFVTDAHDVLGLRQFLLSAQYNWTYPTNQPVSAIDANTSRLTDNAPAFYDSQLPGLFSTPTGPAFPVDTVFQTNDTYLIRLSAAGLGAVGIPSLRQPDRGAWVLLRSSTRTYLFGGLPSPRSNWRILLGRLPRYASDSPVDVAIPATDIVPGTYDIAVVTCTDPQTCQVRPTQRLLTAAPQRPVDRPKSNW